ncbi:ABC transporter substrate-binding protein [Tissierella praeacuta]|uniref:ABC transporter substrate-binding protein n=1 Tax=Tissierella praeacuta TaxID=43131 RepID=UPI0028A68267|nr:ABC transporter substrate-binding protein [Tissierella praeacuta]
MKKSKISKLVSLAVSGIVFLSGCNSNVNKPNSVSEEKIFKIGISQLADHPALDDARLGFEDGLKELGINAEIDYQNAQGDIPTTMSISQKFIKDKVDLIYAIATPAAQSAKQSTNDIPILFSAVTDPVKSEIVTDWKNVGGNVTGTSDMAPTDSQLKMFKEIDPSIKTIGILYNTSEANSEIQIEEVKNLAPNEGLEIITVGISNVNELPQAIDSILNKVDGIYALSDNLIASSVELLSKKLMDKKIISVCAEETQVKGGLLITNGLSYYELGKQTAKMAKEILVDKKHVSTIPVGLAEKTITTVNIKTLEALELDINLSLFKDAIKIEE